MFVLAALLAVAASSLDLLVRTSISFTEKTATSFTSFPVKFEIEVYKNFNNVYKCLPKNVAPRTPKSGANARTASAISCAACGADSENDT